MSKIKKVIYAIYDEGKNKGEAKEINIKDIFYIKMRGKDILYVARQGTFRNPKSLKQLEKCLASEGFKKMDWGKLVNTHAIKSIDQSHITAKFDTTKNKDLCVKISSEELKRIKKNRSVARKLLE